MARSFTWGTVFFSARAFSDYQHGDKVPLKLWREGKELDLSLPVYTYTKDRVEGNQYDVLPRYFIYGGLVFVPLSRDYMRSMGSGWSEPANAPLMYELFYRKHESPETARSEPVILASVLSHSVNANFGVRARAFVDKINGVKIDKLDDVLRAFEQDTGKEQHVIEFGPDHSIEGLDKGGGRAGPFRDLKDLRSIQGPPVMIIRTILLLAVALNTAMAADKSFEDLWERAVVTIEVTRKQYDYLQPWSRRVDQVQKIGTIISDREILTTADYFSSHTLVRLQKGRGRWFEGQVSWIDYHANLAIVTCKEDRFWEGTKKAELPKLTPRRGVAQVVRWRNGILEFRNVDINRLVAKRGKLTFMDTLQLELDSDMQGIGWAEAVVQDDKLIAIASSKDDQTITAIPSPFILTCLEDREKAPYQGLGYFSFVWQTAENPDTLAYLGQEGEPRGVIIIEVQTNRVASPMRPRDIILEIDGFKIDVQGDYNDPDYGNLLLENLASRTKRAGDTVKIKIVRDGKEQMVDYVLPKADYTVEIVPLNVFDQEPEYLIIGGLLFQPLTVPYPYLQSWGADWNRKAPFRLSYATREDATPEKPSYVILSLVLPDPYNIGYQEVRYLIVDKFNGKNINTLHDLIVAKETAADGFHVIEFREGDSLRRIVLDAGQTEGATQRVLERYGIEKDRFLVAPAPGRSEKLARD